MKKNNFKSLAAVLSLAMAATALPVNANAAAAPKLTVSDTTVYSGETYSMTVKNLKKGYTVQFSSTESGVTFKKKKVTSKGAKVTSSFTVKGAAKIADNNVTKIKAVVKNANGKKVKTVSKNVTLRQSIKSVTLKDLDQTEVTVGTVINADATISPAAAKGAYTKKFSSSDTDVLAVKNDKTGLFTAVATGEAIISVSASNGDKTVADEHTITVKVVEAEDAKDTPTTTTPGAVDTTPGTVEDTTPGAVDTTPSAVNTNVAVKATKVSSTSADRVTITFNEKVSASSFLTDDGTVANGTNANKDKSVPARSFELSVLAQARETSTKDDAKNYSDKIVAVLQDSDYSLTFVFENDSDLFLKNDSMFLVYFNDKHVAGATQDATIFGDFSDKTAPQLVSVSEVDKRTIELTFDQPVLTTTADGKNSALNKANILIDNFALSDNETTQATYTKNGKKYALLGQGVKVESTDTVGRNVIRITLGKAAEGTETAVGSNVYFDASATHTVYLRDISDCAGNALTSAAKSFNITENTAAPTFDVTVQSPEQYIIKFSTAIDELAGYDVGAEIPASVLGFDFLYKDTAAHTSDTTTESIDWTSITRDYTATAAKLSDDKGRGL
jgi:hypothetical protein